MSVNNNNYKLVTLCGSTKFEKEFHKINEILTLRNYIVLSLGVFGQIQGKEKLQLLLSKHKEKLDKIHRKKIAMADIVFVINVNEYIGSSTKSEIEYAKSLNKEIWYYSEFDLKCNICGLEWCECKF